MALGGQSSALITVSKAQGWDPTVIQGPGGGESIANFDKDPTTDKMTHKTIGTLPQGTPDTFPDADAPDMGPGVDWQHPQYNDGNQPDRRTSGADPTPGKPGA